KATYALLSNGRVAVVELAQASGLALVPPGHNDPLTATTYGTGQLIAAAIAAHAQRVILAIGGSATNDAGSGALAALGAAFTDADGKPLPPGGAALARLASIDTSELGRRLQGVAIEIASDVKNPLCGPNGAAAVYGPQKGASPADVRTLDAALRRFADVAAATTGVDVRDVPGAGAAGGVGGGFLALAHAVLRPGAQLVLEMLDFDRHLEGASLVLTGEGKIDRQTRSGKAPQAVAAAAKRRRIPVLALAGSIDCPPHELEVCGIVSAASIVPGPMSVEDAMARAEELLEAAAERLARTLTIRLG
ncbi:MAG TPA: glycerate kinase, partial [Candidatus Eremiobacteraceae bacterium]|nr:glycerate kinase [Candidatus Eremiobacteraceae bacterium]